MEEGEGGHARGAELLSFYTYCTLPTGLGKKKQEIVTQGAKYVENRPNTTSAWSRFYIPVDRYGGVHSLLHCTSSPLGSPTCHQAY
jgi:hypothetical protein